MVVGRLLPGLPLGLIDWPAVDLLQVIRGRSMRLRLDRTGASNDARIQEHRNPYRRRIDPSTIAIQSRKDSISTHIIYRRMKVKKRQPRHATRVRSLIVYSMSNRLAAPQRCIDDNPIGGMVITDTHAEKGGCGDVAIQGISRVSTCCRRVGLRKGGVARLSH